MKTFCVQTLGCKVNQYESEQLATLLRGFGLVQTEAAGADLRIINTCSVTVQAASKSRQLARRAMRQPSRSFSLQQFALSAGGSDCAASHIATASADVGEIDPSASRCPPAHRPRVVVTGCWATSDRDAAAAMPGVDAVVTHHQDVAAELTRLLNLWQQPIKTSATEAYAATPPHETACEIAPKPKRNDGWIIEAGTPAGNLTAPNKPFGRPIVNGKVEAEKARRHGGTEARRGEVEARRDGGKEGRRDVEARRDRGAQGVGRGGVGTRGLPLLDVHQWGRQRGHLKIQDGCDAHCTYCIIPRLRPGMWSKPVSECVEEARRLVEAGHREIVLTGIFLGAYGHATALRRRQSVRGAGPLARLIDALCEQVSGLWRLRLSSLEPADLDGDLLDALRSHPQIVPHFHLPLQSGSDALLRRMNRQYTRGDFLRMIERVDRAFDRPAITTDIIVGFPGETDTEFDATLDVVEHARFSHIHAFSFSPRPGTAAARWKQDFVHGPIVNERIELLRERAAVHSLALRRQFVGESVELLVEAEHEREQSATMPSRGGRSDRYFFVGFDDPRADARPGPQTGDRVRVRIDRATPDETAGTLVDWTGAS